MRAILFVNGIYSCYTRYQRWIETADCVVCADGGANQAYEWQVPVHYLVGDMDSIRSDVFDYYKTQSTQIFSCSPIKDETDTQIALNLLMSLGADEVIFVGSMGGRLDHSFSNLLITLPYVHKGMKFLHIDTDCQIWITASEVEILGNPGDIVSVFSLTEKSQGVNVDGFQYPLQDAELFLDHPYAVSNILLGSQGSISVHNGILAIIHFQ